MIRTPPVCWYEFGTVHLRSGRLGEALDGLGDAHHDLGDTAAAREAWQQALAHYTGLKAPEAAAVNAKLGG